MKASQRKVVQYLTEARATEDALIRVLQSQAAMTPHGSYRSIVESHLRETREHSRRVGERLQQLGQGANPVASVVGFWESLLGQTLALSKTPFDLIRGTGGEEKVLKNAKDACATEALEIATYTALERLARSVGDEETAELAVSIREDEEHTLDRIMHELPKLAEAVVRAEIKGETIYDVTETGAADAVREAASATRSAAEKTRSTTRRTARQARRVPGVAQAEGEIKGAVASEDDLAIAHYDDLNADEITGKLADLSQVDLAKIDAYERKNHNRSTVLHRIDSLRGDEPWPGYDEQTAIEIIHQLSEGDDELSSKVRNYERSHKDRAGVIRASEREHARA